MELTPHPVDPSGPLVCRGQPKIKQAIIGLAMSQLAGGISDTRMRENAERLGLHSLDRSVHMITAFRRTAHHASALFAHGEPRDQAVQSLNLSFIALFQLIAGFGRKRERSHFQRIGRRPRSCW